MVCHSVLSPSLIAHSYYVLLAVLIYLLPLLVMGCAYLEVGLTLWASEIPGDSSDRYKEQLIAKRKVLISAPLTGQRPQTPKQSVVGRD